MSCGVPGPWFTQGFVCTLQVSLEGMRLASKCNLAPPAVLLGLLLSPWTQGIFFLVESEVLWSMVVQQLVAILEFSQEKMSARLSTAPFWML